MVPRRARPFGAIIVLLLADAPLTGAFIEEIFGQAFGGGGGAQFQFMDGGQMFEMGGGRRPRKPKWPKGITSKISKQMAWLKGTEWNWNDWRDIKFQKDGTFEAPTRDCQQGTCRWSASKDKVYILWGEAGLHELQVAGEIPKEQNAQKMAGLILRGRRTSDGDPCSAKFRRVFDHEAAEMDKDLYEILGIPDDADEADIKKVYRKLSVKYHPDKNPDEESRKKFADVRDAYEILNDPDKKILYDTGGMEAVKKAEKGEVQKGDDVSAELEISLEDVYNSGMSQASYDRRVVCRGCRARPDSPKCGGCGRCPNEVRMVNRQVGPGMVIQQQEEVASKEKCKNEETVIDVTIEKGMSAGEKVRFDRMAEQSPGMVPGGVVFTLRVKKHPKFERKGNDLHLRMKVTLREALLGWRQRIKHLDGHYVEVETDSVTKPFQVIKVAGEGMPFRDDPSTFGDLYIKVEVVFPPTMLDEQISVVESVFPPQPSRSEL